MNNTAQATPWKWIIGILIVLNLLSLAALWWGQLKPKQHPHPPADPVRIFQHELGLNPEQTATFKKLIERHRSMTRTDHDGIRQKKREMIKVLTTPTPDTARARELASEADQLQKMLDEQLIQHFLELRAICTEDQQEMLGRIFMRAVQHGPAPGRRKNF